MYESEISGLLSELKDGKITVDEALNRLKHLPFEDLDYAKLDHHRAIRSGYPEVIYCQGKSDEHLIGIFKRLLEGNRNILATKATPETYELVKNLSGKIEYHKLAQIIVVRKKEIERSKHKILIVTGGTSDIPVAEEAAVTSGELGSTVVLLYDVGVAGIHRLFSNKEKLDDCSVIIAIAGMEGALASVVGGLVDKPVIAVPTSVGYGASFGGITPLLAMLNSCANGIGVVNIDNGFGAGYLASIIIRQIEKETKVTS